MKNLEQVRAGSALAFCKEVGRVGGQDDGNVLKKLPALIMGNGLLAAAAFAFEKRGGWRACFDHLAKHLAAVEVSILPGVSRLDDMLKKLTDSDSQTLKLATEESLAWLSYARRFEEKKKGADDDSDE